MTDRITKVLIKNFNKLDTDIKTELIMTKNKYLLDSIINTTDNETKRLVAIHGNNSQRDRLINENWIIRKMIAIYGTDKHRDLLVKDVHKEVRISVAKYGNDKHRWKLINDKELEVRCTVAFYGGEKIKNKCLHDWNHRVRNAAKLNKEG